MSDQNQPPTTAEIVAKLRAVSVPVECLDVLNLTHDAADRLESYDRILNNVDGALHSYVLRNLSRLQIAHLIGQQAVIQVNELEAEIAKQERDNEALKRTLLSVDAERATYARRLLWLHDCSNGTADKDGFEWGIFRVKWQDGKAVEVWQTNSDFSDLDAAMQADGWKIPAGYKMMTEELTELRKDKERLNWLDRKSFEDQGYIRPDLLRRAVIFYGNFQSEKEKASPLETLRAAIDAAMRKEAR